MTPHEKGGEIRRKGESRGYQVFLLIVVGSTAGARGGQESTLCIFSTADTAGFQKVYHQLSWGFPLISSVVPIMELLFLNTVDWNRENESLRGPICASVPRPFAKSRPMGILGSFPHGHTFSSPEFYHLLGGQNMDPRERRFSFQQSRLKPPLLHSLLLRASWGAQMVKNLPAVWCLDPRVGKIS